MKALISIYRTSEEEFKIVPRQTVLPAPPPLHYAQTPTQFSHTSFWSNESGDDVISACFTTVRQKKKMFLIEKRRV